MTKIKSLSVNHDDQAINLKRVYNLSSFHNAKFQNSTILKNFLNYFTYHHFSFLLLL